MTRPGVNEDCDFDDVAPEPSSMIESIRAHGYTLPAAIADLIDNSIAARAQNVWLVFEWEGQRSWIRIADDGEGMGQDVLRAAMRLGSRHPLDERDPEDLGRFGLGLKTASLSQCRRLTVASTTDQTHVRRWDLDHLGRPYVKGWQLLKSPAPGSERLLETEDVTDHGTVILWEVMDRLVSLAGSDSAAARSYFFRLVEQVELHLSMVFHRYLAGPKPRLTINLNGNRVNGWDPFLEHHPATQAYPINPITLGADRITVKGFVLPHKDRLGHSDHTVASGPAGWNAQQGFYVYRNERLILPGSWLGLGKGQPWTKEEHYKLARIRLDFSNSMDHLWQIDVKKSTAVPPSAIHDRLYDLASDVRRRAREVYAHRGRYGRRTTRDTPSRPWRTFRRDGVVGYRIDRTHPLVQSVSRATSGDLREELDAMLKIIEETVPVQQIWLDAAEHPDAPSAPFESTDDVKLRRVVEIAYRGLRRHGKLSHETAVARLLSSEEFMDERAVAIIGTLKAEA